MKILICSKYKFHDRWDNLKIEFEKNGHECITPADIDLSLHGKLDNDMSKDEYLLSTKRFFKLIEESDLLYVANFNGEFGNSTMCEIGYAAALGKKIIAFEKLDAEPSLSHFIKRIAKPEEV